MTILLTKLRRLTQSKWRKRSTDNFRVAKMEGSSQKGRNKK